MSVYMGVCVRLTNSTTQNNYSPNTKSDLSTQVGFQTLRTQRERKKEKRRGSLREREGELNFIVNCFKVRLGLTMAN